MFIFSEHDDFYKFLKATVTSHMINYKIYAGQVKGACMVCVCVCGGGGLGMAILGS